MKNNRRIIVFTTLVLVLVLGVVFVYFNSKIATPKAYEVVPSEHQLAWNDLEYYMFIHFGPNTFTDVEWGDGKENPKIFNPTNLDTRQWASVAKNAGMKGIIITAKHHDGFCLWPSQYSTHTVRESLWKDGKGDVLKELSESCKEYGLKFGVYLSPWDQNHPDYNTEAYNQTFANTLTEVLTNYGEVFEQWFDGATDGTSRQIYDWDLFHKTVYTHQPQAIIFSDVGPGCRWIGNEAGYAGETNWSRLNVNGFTPGVGAPSTDILNQGQQDGELWIPGEVDVSIRPGWFYSPSTDDKVKSVEHLMDIYYASVGRNSNLLLNVPPDRRGRIHPADSARLMEFKKAREEAFEDNLAKTAWVSASSVRGKSNKYSASNLLNGDKKSYWTTNDELLEGWIELDFKKEVQINRVLLQEYIALGQRIAEFNLEAWDMTAKKWTKITDATTVGYKRILRFPTVSTSKIRINITKSLACPILVNVEVYKSPEQLTAPVIRRNKEGLVSIQCRSNDPLIYYTTDGTEPSASSTLYETPFPLAHGGEVKAVASINGGDTKSEEVNQVYDISPISWEITPQVASNAIDDNVQTEAEIDSKTALQINLKKEYLLKGFSYTPTRDNSKANILRYNFYVSSNGNTWTKVKSDAMFDNIKNNPIKQEVLFATPISASHIKIEVVQLTQNMDKYAVSELGVVTR